MQTVQKSKVKPISIILDFLIYLSFSATSLFSTRGALAYYAEYSGFPTWFANDIVAFFIGGVVPTAIYLFAANMRFRTIKMRIPGRTDALRSGLDITIIISNVVLFGLKFIYLAVPLYAALLDIILVPCVTLIFVGAYLWFAFTRNYVEKSAFGFVVTQIMTTFFLVYGVLALLNLVMTVV